MITESRTFRVGQEVRVSYTARVVEVGGLSPHREDRIIRLETTAIPTGWVDPSQEGLEIEVIMEPLPTEPGMYWANDDSISQSMKGPLHTDGKRFFYRNASAAWVDVGFGAPHPDDCPLIPLVEYPF